MALCTPNNDFLFSATYDFDITKPLKYNSMFRMSLQGSHGYLAEAEAEIPAA